jgi:Ca-activated chloride channel homolog
MKRIGITFLLISLGISVSLTALSQSGQSRPRQVTEGTASIQKPAKQTEAGQPINEDEVLKISSDLTIVLMTAVDKDKRLVTTMQQADIRLLENGQPQEITTFQRETDLPLSLALLVDVSKSQEDTLPDEKAAARQFINSVMRPNKDEVAVVSFTGEATVEQELTNNTIRLESALNRVEIVEPPRGGTIFGTDPYDRRGSTAIWDAVFSTSRELLTDAPETRRRAMILLTDGVDTSSRVERQEAIDQAVKDNVLVYAIGIHGSEGMEKDTLKKLTERTGGRAFFPKNEADLRTAFAQIEAELRSQYLIAYTPANREADGSFRKIAIEILNPDLKKQKLRLLYREGYYAIPKAIRQVSK